MHHEMVETIVEAGLCMGCGTCAGVCSADAIAMAETPGGLLLPSVNRDVCTDCGLCAEVCPGWHLEQGIPEAVGDPFTGRVLAAYSGYAAEPGLRQRGQSGGVVTALLEHLLDAGLADQVVVTQMPDDGSLRPQPIRTADRDTIRLAVGSKYCPVPVMKTLGDAGNAGRRAAVVGLGCHLQGLHNVLSLERGQETDVALTIGLFCEHVLAFGAMDYLIGRLGIARSDVASLRFKSKQWRGWPGDVSVRTQDGCDHFVDRSARFICKGTFAPARCRLCFDRLNVFGDLAVGDPWGMKASKEGDSIVLVRTARGREALDSAAKAGGIRMEPVDPDAVFKGQAIEQRRLEWTAYTALWRNMGREPPQFGIEPRWQASLEGVDLRPFRRRLGWAVRLEQAVSHEQALRMARRHIFLTEVLRRLTLRRVLAALWRRVKRKVGL